MHISLAESLKRLPRHATPKWPLGVFDIEAFRSGTMSLQLFAPRGEDFQTPHEQDELYFVVAGSGTFRRGATRFPFEPGDVLFVPAGEDHRFEVFTADFVTWVVFWGPAGGESPSPVAGESDAA